MLLAKKIPHLGRSLKERQRRAPGRRQQTAGLQATDRGGGGFPARRAGARAGDRRVHGLGTGRCWVWHDVIRDWGAAGGRREGCVAASRVGYVRRGRAADGGCARFAVPPTDWLDSTLLAVRGQRKGLPHATHRAGRPRGRGLPFTRGGGRGARARARQAHKRQEGVFISRPGRGPQVPGGGETGCLCTDGGGTGAPHPQRGGGAGGRGAAGRGPPRRHSLAINGRRVGWGLLQG
ncbi:MAG: hypothetical protein J3K34DRAFT_148039 [Monoraphidium minutum]|nr:MAG: hypothetical protein J3K34DRAFT_148039 [Monoraphidium minutum]